MVTKLSKIDIAVELDLNNIPELITWNATDAATQNNVTKAIFLSTWDHTQQTSMRMDLWTKDMTVDEMKLFFYQNFLLMAETLERSTNETNMALTLKDFAEYFAEKMNISLPK